MHPEKPSNLPLLPQFFLGETEPSLPPSAFVAPGAIIIGAATMGEESSLWYGAVVRADINHIIIGAQSNVQDGSVLHVSDDHACEIGERVTIGHRAVVHACQVEDEVLVGMLDAITRRGDQRDDLADRKVLVGNVAVDRQAFDQLHDQVCTLVLDMPVEHTRDVRMVKLGRDRGLGGEQLGAAGGAEGLRTAVAAGFLGLQALFLWGGGRMRIGQKPVPLRRRAVARWWARSRPARCAPSQ